MSRILEIIRDQDEAVRLLVEEKQVVATFKKRLMDHPV